jgi:hypothetical protein
VSIEITPEMIADAWSAHKATWGLVEAEAPTDEIDAQRLYTALYEAMHRARPGVDVETVNGEEMPEVTAMRYIEQLRSEEGASVEILCDNPEAESASVQTAIDCCGSWTDWETRRFYGESVLQCLAKAVCAAQEAAIAAMDDQP